MENAPILITVYNRNLHFQNCVESLKNCDLANQSHLYVAIDAPFRKEDVENNRIIKDYAKSILGFNKLTLLIRERNLGIEKNFHDAVTQIFNRYDKLIYSEDDNIFSTDFLSYVNNGLAIYRERVDIFSINGYNFPIIIPNEYQKEIYIWQGFSAWGVGIWKNKWEGIDWDFESAIKIINTNLNNYSNVLDLNSVANHYISALMTMIKLNRIHVDGYISMHHVVNKMYSVFPVVSRVRNLGHDGSGANCGYMENDLYKDQEIHFGTGPQNLPFDIKADKQINHILKMHFDKNLKSQIRTLAKLILMNTGLFSRVR